MTLPIKIRDCMSELDAWTSGQDIEPEWRELRAHLLSQDAEISNLRDDRDSWLDQASQRLEDWDDMRRRAEYAESRLAAADALLSRCFVQIGELTKGLDPHDPIYVELQQLGLDWMQHSEADTAHLSENTHDRA